MEVVEDETAATAAEELRTWTAMASSPPPKRLRRSHRRQELQPWRIRQHGRPRDDCAVDANATETGTESTQTRRGTRCRPGLRRAGRGGACRDTRPRREPVVARRPGRRRAGAEVPVDTAPNAHGKAVSKVAQDKDAVGGKNCNHGGAVSEAAQKDQAAKDAAKAAAKAEKAKNHADKAKSHGKKNGG